MSLIELHPDRQGHEAARMEAVETICIIETVCSVM